LQLRPGITVDDISDILPALVDGLELRTIGNRPAEPIDDHDRKRTAPGMATLPLVYGFFEPDDHQREGAEASRAGNDLQGPGSTSHPR
jgi:hypothetical protein